MSATSLRYCCAPSFSIALFHGFWPFFSIYCCANVWHNSVAVYSASRASKVLAVFLSAEMQPMSRNVRSVPKESGESTKRVECAFANDTTLPNEEGHRVGRASSNELCIQHDRKQWIERVDVVHAIGRSYVGLACGVIVALFGLWVAERIGGWPGAGVAALDLAVLTRVFVYGSLRPISATFHARKPK